MMSLFLPEKCLAPHDKFIREQLSWLGSFFLGVTVALNWATIVGSVIAIIIGDLLLRAFDHALKEGYLKRVFLIVESVYDFGMIAWLLAVLLFYVEPSPRADPVPI